MADIEFIIPGFGIINDTEEGFESLLPGSGIYNQQSAPPPPAGDIVVLRRRREEA